MVGEMAWGGFESAGLPPRRAEGASKGNARIPKNGPLACCACFLLASETVPLQIETPGSCSAVGQNWAGTRKNQLSMP